MKYVMVTLLIIASVLGAVYTFDAVLEAESQRVEPPKENELRIVANNFTFDKEEYVVQQGEPVVVTLMNESGYHEVVIEELGVNITDAEPQELTFEAGTYTLRCSFLCGTGHANMVATLVVGAGGAEQPAEGEEGAEQPAGEEGEEQPANEENAGTENDAEAEGNEQAESAA